MNIMVLAAGRGSRLAPLTDTCPKPLLDVGGCSLLQRVLLQAQAAGFTAAVINLSWLGEQIRQAVAHWQLDLPVQFSPEMGGRLETGGGIRQALPLLGDSVFAVVNADVLTDFALSRLLQRAQQWPAGDLAHLVLVPNPKHHQQGDFGLVDGRVQNRPEYTFAGISLLHPQLFASSPKEGVFPLAPLLRAAIDAGRVSGELHRGYWNDVGTPQRLDAARSAVATLHPVVPSDQ
jgi:MurNAc alpha-1-phosphate uridylyltransferase